MSLATERLVALNKSQLEAGIEVMQALAQGWERMVHLNLKAGGALWRESVELTRALMSRKDGSGWSAVSDSVGARSWKRIHGYSSHAYEIAASTGTAVGAILEQKLHDLMGEWTETVEVVLSSSPTGSSEVTVSAVKSTVANAAALIDGISKAAKEAAEYADATVRAAATATAEAVSASAGKQDR